MGEADFEEALYLLRCVDDYGVRRQMRGSRCNRLDTLLMKYDEDEAAPKTAGGKDEE